MVEFRITLTDAPGALAKVAGILARNTVDLLSSESRTLRRGRSAEWIIIADISKCTCKLDDLQRKIVEEGNATKVTAKGLT